MTFPQFLGRPEMCEAVQQFMYHLHNPQRDCTVELLHVGVYITSECVLNLAQDNVVFVKVKPSPEPL